MSTMRSGFLLAFCLFCAANLTCFAEDAIYCTSGFIMDQLCIDLGVLLDRPSKKTLEEPDQHSIHCLVDVKGCIDSGYTVLVPSSTGNGYEVDVVLDETGNTMVLDAARTVGTSCSTCYSGGTQSHGFAATVVGKLDESEGNRILNVEEVFSADTPCPVPAPAPTLPPTNFCFSGEMSVQVREGEKKMKDLAIGDVVMTSAGVFEPVYSFGHRDITSAGDFLRLKTSRSTLELSKNHMVLVGERFVPASMVQVGDELVLVKGNSVGRGRVESISEVVGKGMFAPFTASGTIVVNGVKASTFVAFQDSDVLKLRGFKTPITYQWIARAFEFPHRFYCQYVGTCTQEKYTKEGLSVWVSQPYHVTCWLLDDSGEPTKFALLTTAMMVFGLFALVDWIFTPLGIFALCVGIAYCRLLARSKTKLKTL